MATHHGKNGVIKIGANSVAEVTAFNYTQTADTAEDSAMGDTDKTYLAGLNDSSGDLTAWYDPSDTNGQETMLIGASVTLLLYPEDGAASGETEISVPAIMTEVGTAVERDGITVRSFNFQGTGAPTFGTS